MPQHLKNDRQAYLLQVLEHDSQPHATMLNERALQFLPVKELKAKITFTKQIIEKDIDNIDKDFELEKNKIKLHYTQSLKGFSTQHVYIKFNINAYHYYVQQSFYALYQNHDLSYFINYSTATYANIPKELQYGSILWTKVLMILKYNIENKNAYGSNQQALIDRSNEAITLLLGNYNLQPLYNYYYHNLPKQVHRTSFFQMMNMFIPKISKQL